MEPPVFIERLPDGDRYIARLGEPFNLAAEAATADEAQDRLTDALRRQLQQGAELRLIAGETEALAPVDPFVACAEDRPVPVKTRFQKPRIPLDPDVQVLAGTAAWNCSRRSARP
jgi:hypothetical protein